MLLQVIGLLHVAFDILADGAALFFLSADSMPTEVAQLQALREARWLWEHAACSDAVAVALRRAPVAADDEPPSEELAPPSVT